VTRHTPHTTLVASRPGTGQSFADQHRSRLSGRCTDRTVMLAQFMTAIALASILVTTLWVLRILGG
jgi:hypothetical protein